MTEVGCERVLIAQMAAMDGEEPAISKDQLAAHIVGCVNCQQQLTQMQTLDQLLAGHTLSDSHVELWPAIENRIPRQTVTLSRWQPFVLIGLLLVIYKLLELLPTRDLGLAFKLVPLAIVPLLFLLIKENPFRINPDLVLER